MSDSNVITQRFKEFIGTKTYKTDLQSSLFSIMKDGEFFKLKRNKVMIKNTTSKTKDKYIILDVYRNNKGMVYYCCPICCDRKIVESLTEGVHFESLSHCIHSDVCKILWGDQYELEPEPLKDNALIEIIRQKPMYMAIVHPAPRSEKKSGLIVLTTKTLTPKCLTCSSRGKNFCLHLKIHRDKLNQEAESSEDDSEDTILESQKNVLRKLQNKRIMTELPSTKDDIEGESEEVDAAFNPFKFSGPASNVFGVKINFLPTQEEEVKNRKISETNKFFEGKVLIPPYLGKGDTCELHGREFNPGINILWKESSDVEIHHTKKVNTKDVLILYRPTIPDNDDEEEACICKKFFTGEDENLLRVSSASFTQSMKTRAKKIHLVSYELLFKYLSELLTGGEKLDAFIKSNQFMSEIFFGLEKTSAYSKIIQKGFEIFIHALQFPEKANFCFQCPQKLGDGEQEDTYDDIEYSVVDGVQMGCQTNEAKGYLPKEVFEEETIDDDVVLGVEVKNRTCLNSKVKRDAVSELVKNVENRNALKETIKKLENTSKDDMTDKVVAVLKRISEKHKTLPKGYQMLFEELKLDTPISALLTAYTSDRKIYSLFYKYLKRESYLFDNAKKVEEFVNSFPVIWKIMQDILEEEKKLSVIDIPYLPPDVADIFKEMIRLRGKFDRLSKSVAAARKSPHPDFKPPAADFFPDYDIHTMSNIYQADAKHDKEEGKDCQKEFEKSSHISGGIGTVTCNHRVTKGFRVIERGESPLLFLHAILRRFPIKVKAKKRVIVYDFACKMHKCALRRFPYRVRRFQFVIDRHHQANHTSCSQGYDMNNYPCMNNINSQLAEQLNNSLRKLATVSAYSKFETYKKILEIFVTVKNLKIKGII